MNWLSTNSEHEISQINFIIIEQIRSFENSLHLEQLLLTREAYWTAQLFTLFLCLQHETSSFLLFSVQRCGSRIIINFSSKHKLQRLLALLYGLARAMICHVITWLILLSFNDQTY